MIQASLLEYDARAHARAGDPITSHESAEAAETLSNRHCRLILEVLKEHDRPMAAEEIADAMQTVAWPALDTVQTCKRLADLLARGAIARTDERHVNRSGRSAFRVRLA